MKLAFIGVDHPHGAGWRELLGNFSDTEISLAAIVPGLDGQLASLEERWADLPRFDDVASLIEGGSFDGAIVCLDNASGPEAVERLAAAGKHVLVEKPMAADLQSAESALAAVSRSGVAFQTGYMWRYDDAANRMRRMARDGQFGKLISVEMTFVTSDVSRRGPSHYLFDPARSGRGFFNWLACHYLDLLLYVTGQEVRSVTARLGVFGETEVDVEDGGAVVLELSGGALATFVGGYWIPRWAGEAQWVVRGSQRWVRWRPEVEGGQLEIHGPQPQWHAMEETFRAPAQEASGYGGPLGVALMRDWLEAATAGRPCRNTVDSTRKSLQLLDAIQRASDSGRRVDCG